MPIIPLPNLYPDQHLIGNQGTAMQVPNNGQLITLADVRLADMNSPRTMIVNIQDKLDDSQGIVANHDYILQAIVQYGHAGNAAGAGLFDIGHNKTFSVNCSNLRVLGLATGGVAGQNGRMCATITLGSGTIPVKNAAAQNIVAAASLTIPARMNDDYIEIFTDAPYSIEILAIGGGTNLIKTYAANSRAEKIPAISNGTSWRITNLGAADASFMYVRTKQF